MNSPSGKIFIAQESIRRMLVRVPNWVGDAVMCTPALTILRESFPGTHIAVLARPSICELLGNHPAIDEVFVYDHRGRHAGMSGKLALVRKLRLFHADVAVLFQNAFEAAWLTWLAGIRIRYGYATDGRRGLLSHPIPPPTWAAQRHHVEYFCEMLRPLDSMKKPPAPNLEVTAKEELQMSERLAEFGVDDSTALIGVNPGSVYGGAKRWLPERFAETADRLVNALEPSQWMKKTIRCVIVGGSGEEALEHAIAGQMKSKVVALSGQTTIRELMAVIKRCRCFITNDTGPMHIADAFGVPLVAVFGSTNPHTTSPHGNSHAVVRHPVRCAPCLLRWCPIDHRCMTGVSVEEVLGAAIHQIEHSDVSQSITVNPL